LITPLPVTSTGDKPFVTGFSSFNPQATVPDWSYVNVNTISTNQMEIDFNLFNGNSFGGISMSYDNFLTTDNDPTTTTDPTNQDTDRDRVVDGVEDANRNGRVDPGESDPNDPADPAVACTPGGPECPPGTACQGGICRVAASTDGGVTCRLLADQRIECCMGGCSTANTPVSPICLVAGGLEQCPIGAMQCTQGTCGSSGSGGGLDPDGGGCRCGVVSLARSSGSGSARGLFSLLLFMLLGFRARGRGARAFFTCAFRPRSSSP
jgi:hypothetical protein